MDSRYYPSFKKNNKCKYQNMIFVTSYHQIYKILTRNFFREVVLWNISSFNYYEDSLESSGHFYVSQMSAEDFQN